MPQKFRHLNCFFTCGITPSNLLKFCTMAFAVGGCTRAPNSSASLVRAMRSLIAFALSQLFDLIISLYGPDRDATDEIPYQKLACTRICWRGPTVSAGDRGATSCSSWSSHG